MPLAVERAFSISIDGIPVNGIIDRVDKLDGGGLAVTDYKTSKQLFTADYLANDLQLTIYQLAVESMWRLPVERLTLYHLRSNTPCSCGPRDRDTLDQTRRLITEVAGKIAAGSFPATENTFCPCDFPEYCPFYRQNTAAAKQEILPGLAAAEAVEEYVKLQQDSKEMEKRLEVSRQTIIDFCRSEGINRVYGTEHAITYNAIERAGFIEDEVRETLRSCGLWDEVSSLDQAKLKKLLLDGKLDEELKKNLRGMSRVLSTYPQLRVKRLKEETE